MPRLSDSPRTSENDFRVGIDTNPTRPLRLGRKRGIRGPGRRRRDRVPRRRPVARRLPAIDLGAAIALDASDRRNRPGGHPCEPRWTDARRSTHARLVAARITFDAAPGADLAGAGGRPEGRHETRSISLRVDQASALESRDSQARPALRASIKGSFRF